SGANINYNWNFGDGATGEGKITSHIYTSAGNYEVVLVVSDGEGNESVYSLNVNIENPLQVEYMVRLKNNRPKDDVIQVNFQINNTSSSPVPYNELTLRYWYTKEGTAEQEFSLDYPAVAAGRVDGSFTPLDQPVAGADHYLEISFDDPRVIAAGSKSIEFRTHFSKTNGSRFNETNDYSYDPYRKVYSEWDRITLYRNGQLVWGVEPPANADSADIKSKDYPYSVEVFPNPVSGNEVEVNVSLDSESFVLLSVHSLTGKAKLVKNLGYHAPGKLKQLVNIEGLAKGIYLMQLRTKGRTYQARLIRQ